MAATNALLVIHLLLAKRERDRTRLKEQIEREDRDYDHAAVTAEVNDGLESSDHQEAHESRLKAGVFRPPSVKSILTHISGYGAPF